MRKMGCIGGVLRAFICLMVLLGVGCGGVIGEMVIRVEANREQDLKVLGKVVVNGGSDVVVENRGVVEYIIKRDRYKLSSGARIVVRDGGRVVLEIIGK